MDGVSNVSAALGIVSFGIEVCQGLIEYYNSWKDYKTDIATAHDVIRDLCQTLTLIQESTRPANLDEARVARVQRCLDTCVEGLGKLQKKLIKIRTHAEPSGSRQKMLAEFQRLSYPFKESTLAKLREEVGDLRKRLSEALQVLQLDLSTETHAGLKSVATDVQQLVTGQQAAQFQKVIDWLSPPDPWTNHASARKLHEPHTGKWLLQSGQYQQWKRGEVRHMWFYGNAGCGKTVLSSTVIEDVKRDCETATDSTLAIFYFTFSDNRKQSFESLLRSLVDQLGSAEPGRSMLQREYDKSNRNPPTPAALEEILLSCIAQPGHVFLVLDALDECPEFGEARRSMLDCLQRLSENASNLKIFATSRELGDIRGSMASLKAMAIQTSTRPVDADIGLYVANELSRDRKLNKLDDRTKALIMDTFAQKADGMFRWAYCQLLELKKLKFTKPSHIRTSLLALPPTLDDTYERILTGIDDVCRDDALMLLRWLVYAERPLSLRELVEVTITDPSGNGTVDTDDRVDDPEGVLDILAGLVVVDETESDGCDDIDSEEEDSEEKDGEDFAEPDIEPGRRMENDVYVRLAHFSVQEYLESERIHGSSAKQFHLDKTKEHDFLAQSCLTYLLHYSSSGEKTSTETDLLAFPLLEYAARSWYHHSSFQQSADVSRETRLLGSNAIRHDWFLVHDPDTFGGEPFTDNKADYMDDPWTIGSGIYYASLLGLQVVVDALLDAGCDVDAEGGQYGNALQAALNGDHEEIVKLLIEKGANVNAQGGYYGSALQAASDRGHLKVVEVLLDSGADVHARGGDFDTALGAASYRGHEDIMDTLIRWGADVNVGKGGEGFTPLECAAYGGRGWTVKRLLDAGAHINAPSLQGGALQAAAEGGHHTLISTLIELGADVNIQGGNYGSALQAAASHGDEKVVSTLLERGADVNMQDKNGSALQTAIWKGREKVAEMLIERGADVNARGGIHGSPLTLAAERGWEKMTIVLLEQGADVNGPGGRYGSALQAAIRNGHEKVAEMLIERGADVNALGGKYGSVLSIARARGYWKLAEMLTQHGAPLDPLEEVIQDLAALWYCEEP